MAPKVDPNPAADAAQQILSRLNDIDHKVESLRHTQGFALRVDKERVFAEVKDVFKKSSRKAQVYLAANGNRSVNEIAAHLVMKRQNVGRELKALYDENLLDSFPVGNVDIWRKTPLDKVVGITRFLMAEYALDADGKAGKAKAKGKPKSKKK
jgi:hypothetical protein